MSTTERAHVGPIECDVASHTIVTEDDRDLLRALTVWQPWARQLCEGVKRAENRGWTSPYRGVLLIHAGHGVALDEPPITRETHPAGVIVGAVQLLAIHEARPGCCQLPGADHSGDRMSAYHWECEPVALFDRPVKARGQLQCWTPTSAALDAVCRQLTREHQEA